jgi:DNA-directed RNA polymerase subunit RPC12/RpoP
MAENFAVIVVLDEVVCRSCAKKVEEISAMRGFHDTLSYEEVAENEIICTRCNNQIKKQ